MRIVGAIVAGVITAFLTIYLVEWAGHFLFPPPPDVDFSDPAQLKELAGRMPVGALMPVLLAWVLGVLAGGFVAAKVGRTGPWPAWVIAAVVLAGALFTVITIPHPTWFVVVAIVLIAGAGYLAGWLAWRGEAAAEPALEGADPYTYQPPSDYADSDGGPYRD